MAIQKVPAGVRLPDWEHRLFGLITDSKSRPFKWGEFDCIVWVAMCYEAVTGVQIKRAHMKRDGEKKAALLLAKHGGVHGAICSELGEPVSPKLARRGDIVEISFNGRSCAGVCVGSEAVVVDTHGLVQIPMTKASAAWRI